MLDSILLIALGLMLLTLAGLALWLRAALRTLGPRPEDRQALAELRGQMAMLAQQSSQTMDGLRQHVLTLQGQVTQSLNDTRRAMDERLDGAARVIQGVSRQLGQLDESTKRMLEVGRDISSLQDLLRAPKLRGNLGELFLQDLLAQILPPDHYETQHAFAGGEKVDAVIRLQAGLVPVDAKFPLENFRRVVAAAGDEERKTARKQFLRDVRTHIDAIATKYIRPDEGTFQFALMYVPAENVYYETIVRPDEAAESALFEYALQRRVIPVSPNSFYAYLQTILLGLKGLRVEERAREILDHLDRLNQETDRFAEAFRLVGDHLDNARKKYEEAQKRLTRVESKMDQLDGLAKGEAALPPAAPPA